MVQVSSPQSDTPSSSVRFFQAFSHSICPSLDSIFHVYVGSKNKHADYAALFLQIIGVYAGAPCLSTWNSNNVQPHYRRATAIAAAFASTNIGGAFTTISILRVVQLIFSNLDRHRLYVDIHRPSPLPHRHEYQPRLLTCHGCPLCAYHGLPTLRQQEKTKRGRKAGEGVAGEWRLGVG